MKLLRTAWVILVVVVLALDVAGVPFAYREHVTLCTRSAEFCIDETNRLTPEAARDLADIGVSRQFYAAYLGVALDTFFTLACLGVAAVIFLRRSDEHMALLAAFVLVLFGGAGAAGTMADLEVVHPALWFAVNLLDYASQVSFVAFFLLFPDGRFVPRWTRLVAVAAVLYFVLDIFFPGSPVEFATEPLFLLFVLSLVAVQVYRYRQVSTPEQRQQTKWVVFGFGVGLGGFAAIIAASALVPSFSQAGPLGVMVVITLIYGFLLLVPLSIGMAILRSRLYDIDVVINQALVYGSLTAMLVGVYVGSVVLLQYLLRALTGQGSTLAIVASTLAIAALFVPLRSRVQALIDRRFYRQKYDAAKTLDEFGVRLRDEVDLDDLTGDLVLVVRDTVAPEHVSLWLRPASRGRGRGTI